MLRQSVLLRGKVAIHPVCLPPAARRVRCSSALVVSVAASRAATVRADARVLHWWFWNPIVAASALQERAV